MLQAYSALPFNITSGVTTIQGTAGRPIVNGAFIERNAGTGSDFFTLNARLSRVFRLRGRVKLEALVEGFNLTNRRNVLDEEHELRGRRVSGQPVADVRPDHGCRRPENLAVRTAGEVLT